MKHHLLLILLILVAVASNVYVSLWEHRDAPSHVKLALLLGGLAIALLALIVGPAALKRGRAAIVPV